MAVVVVAPPCVLVLVLVLDRIRMSLAAFVRMVGVRRCHTTGVAMGVFAGVRLFGGMFVVRAMRSRHGNVLGVPLE